MNISNCIGLKNVREWEVVDKRDFQTALECPELVSASDATSVCLPLAINRPTHRSCHIAGVRADPEIARGAPE